MEKTRAKNQRKPTSKSDKSESAESEGTNETKKTMDASLDSMYKYM